MTLNQAIEIAKNKAAGNAKWTRAIERAAAGLLDGSICVTLLSDYALVTTATGQHRVNGHCDCTAAKHGHKECVHRVAKRIAEMMDAEPVATKAATRDELIADIKRTIHPFDLLARFHTTDFQLFATETLADIVAAIA